MTAERGAACANARTLLVSPLALFAESRYPCGEAQAG